MTSNKRKLPEVGIFDPNFSQDPQYGNVSTLRTGLKRIHLHYEGNPTGENLYVRNLIVIPECNIPKIDSRNIDSVGEITVPIIKNFEAVIVENSTLEKDNTEALILVGAFESDNLSRGPFPCLSREGEPEKIEINNMQSIFIMNKPIAYTAFEMDKVVPVSNMSERGYVILQNYVNIFYAWKQLKKTNPVSIDVYLDYTTCTIPYKDALVWKADFEKMIQGKLKYRVDVDSIKESSILLSRGELQRDEEDDPEDFKPVVNSTKLYKVAERELEKAALSNEEFAWTEAMKKYMNKL